MEGRSSVFKRGRELIGLLVVLGGAAATLTLYNMLATNEQEAISADLDRRTEELASAIEQQVGANFEGVNSLARFFLASENVTVEEFMVFTQHLLTHQRGVHSLQWIPHITAEEREKHESAPLPASPYLGDDDGGPTAEDYQIRELVNDELVPAAERDEYFPIYYISPLERTFWGLDLGAIPTARRAMAEAKRTDQLAATRLIREELVWVFGYVHREPAADRGQDGEAVPLDGFVAAAFRGDRILESVLGLFSPADISVEVWDESAEPDELLYETQEATPEEEKEEEETEESLYFWRPMPDIESVAHVDLGMRTWRIESEPGVAFVAARRGPGPLAVLVGGSATTVLLAAYLWSVIVAAQRARQEAEDRAVRARQQAVVAKLGVAAMSNRSLDQLMQQVCEAVADTLNVDFAGVLELLPEGDALFLRAGVGWAPGEVGRRKVDAGRASQAGYTLTTKKPIVVSNAARETRFKVASVLLSYGVHSGVTVAIQEEDRPYGVLGAHSRKRREFGGNDVAFIQAVSSVLGQAIAQRRLENELRESEQLFRTMADAAPALIWIADTRQRRTYVNRQWLTFSGRTLERELGEGWMDRVHHEDVPHWKQTFSQAFERRAPFRTEYRLRDRDGRYHWMVDQAVPRQDPNGRFFGYIGSGVDITDQKRAEQQLRELNETLEQRVEQRTEQLQRANEELERQVAERRRAETELQQFTQALARSNRELEQFAYIASHDLQEPLRKIEGFGQMLASHAREALDDESQDYLSRMVSASRRMRDLINGLLAYSRVTTRVQPFRKVDLNKLVSEVLEDLEIRVRETDAKIDLAPLPTVEGDPLQLRQLFQNLIGNALKFHKADEPPHVWIRARQEALDETGATCEWHLEVSDAGIGIDPKYHDRLFVPFQRPIHGRDQYEGTGIGLAVCRKIAETHGGRITVRSTPGEGSTFEVVLPCSKSGEGDEDAARAGSAEANHHSDGGG